MTEASSGWAEQTVRLDAAMYEQHRPTYPAGLFQTIFAYAQLQPDSRCLEIGIGTGQATQPFLDAGHHVLALEPAANLFSFVRGKFRSNTHLTIAPAKFEEIGTAEQFSLVYSATAFHWVRSTHRMQMLLSHLVPGGCAALFWNHPNPLNPVHSDVQEVYHHYFPDQQNIEWTADDADKIAVEMESGGFQDVQTTIFHSRRKLSTAQYIGLLHTYSNHISLPSDVRVPFMHDLSVAIDAHDGFITIADTVDLHLGRR